MTAAPLVSVIIPVWNGARFLPEALASIQVQNYTPLEILVIDDGSTDETAQIATRSEYNIRYLAFPHRGLVPTRLAGITAARGEFIAFLDVDDLWSATKLQTQLALLRENPNLMIVNGYTQLMRLVHANAETMRFETGANPFWHPVLEVRSIVCPSWNNWTCLTGPRIHGTIWTGSCRRVNELFRC